MSDLDRFLRKYGSFPREGAYKTYETLPQEIIVPREEEPTKPTKPGFVGFVGPSAERETEFRDDGPPLGRVRVRGRRRCLACRPGKDCRICEELSRNGWFASHYCGPLEWRRRHAN